MYGGPGASSAALLFGDLMLYLSLENGSWKTFKSRSERAILCLSGPVAQLG
jgi:hypothetical protein